MKQHQETFHGNITSSNISNGLLKEEIDRYENAIASFSAAATSMARRRAIGPSNSSNNNKWVRSTAQHNGSSAAVVPAVARSNTMAHPPQPLLPLHAQPTLQKAGMHKLILTGSATKNTNISAAVNGNVAYQKRQKMSYSQNKDVVVVKRIQLNTTIADDTSSATYLSNIPTNYDDSAIVTTRLTDFAYRCLPATATMKPAPDTTSTSYHRARPPTKPPQTTTTKQLVRVKPGEYPEHRFAPTTTKKLSPTLPNTNTITSDNGNHKFVRATNAPTTKTMNRVRHQQQYTTVTEIKNAAVSSASSRICPVVLSGKECANMHCTKRHDIPRRMAMPICTFFQRQGGQCQKGDSCRFMHVKVNPQAEICPVFQKFGHCSAGESCQKKHIRGATHILSTTL